MHHLGASYVLASGKDVYRLDRQEEAEKLAGQKVVVKGTLDKPTNTISVVAMESANRDRS